MITWFGTWPSFHDAEVLSVHVNRRATSHIRLHASTVREDEHGMWVVDREATVRFDLRDLSSLLLEGEGADGQNVIDGIVVEQTPDGYRLQLEPCYGLSGEIVARHLSVQIETEGPPRD